jgi:hypothetical protein
MKLIKPSILVVNWVSSCLSFLLSASTAATYIFTALTKMNLEPCALNAEFRHFLRFNKSVFTLWIPQKARIGVKRGGPKRGWRQGYFTDNFNKHSWIEMILLKFLFFLVRSDHLCFYY